MEIRIEYMDGSIIVLKHVKTITLAATGKYLLDGSEFDIQCFGNDSVRHRFVKNLDIIGW